NLIKLIPVWNPVVIKQTAARLAPSARTILIGGTREQQASIRDLYPNTLVLDVAQITTTATLCALLEAEDNLQKGAIEQLIWIAPAETNNTDTLIEDQQQGALQIFRIIKALLALEYGKAALTWTLLTTQTQAVHRTES